MRIFIQSLTVVALSAVFTLGANAEDSRSKSVIYVLASTLLDVESGPILRDHPIIIVGDRISKIGSIADVQVVMKGGRVIRELELR